MRPQARYDLATGKLASQTAPDGGTQTTSYTYDVLSATLPDGRTLEYAIDASNRRIGKQINGVLVLAALWIVRIRHCADTLRRGWRRPDWGRATE